MVRLELTIRGRVQGVAFRWCARERAEGLGVAGWVRNLHDGRVETWIEGDEEAVARMEAWLASGPPSARVDALDVREREPEGFGAFEVRRSAY